MARRFFLFQIVPVCYRRFFLFRGVTHSAVTLVCFFVAIICHFENFVNTQFATS